ncbi:MAG: [protein-PII] uridylyltransferase [Gammaproteobacteria bacterium]|nr:[protein-PII] uridylyltransferase [Gammaproteobacteria bacterium]
MPALTTSARIGAALSSDDVHKLKLDLEQSGDSLPAWRDALACADARLAEQFLAGAPVQDLVIRRACLVDCLLLHLWRQHCSSPGGPAALIAVGGYGRCQLHPGSDIDVMLLLDDAFPESEKSSLSTFLTCLWDLGLDIGHSVRTIGDCEREAAADSTIVTTLMETRLLAGPAGLLEALQVAISPDRMWPSDRFFAAKSKEQRARHRRYDDTAYKLEPNVKGSPGGLRDIQMIGWVARRHFGVGTFTDLVERKFLTPGQAHLLREGQAFLWRVRFGLHLLTGRREDRLLFDHQKSLAQMLGYEDASYTLAVEQLMQRYYRTVMELSRLNEMLLQQFEEAILLDPAATPEPLNERFQVKNGYLQTVDDEVFRRTPSALLEVFLLLQQHRELRGVSAYTVGLIKQNLHLIDEEFRQSPRNHRLFLNILRAPSGVTHELRRMNRYGVLGLYIPAFGRIVGRMQYDLFHAYTVDEHTLFVVSNLRRFALSRFDHEYPRCSPLMQSFKKPEIVYLAGLFHDIAKGRGGDHSELGAIDAETFCLEHGLSQYDARTVAWLVRNHLILSVTAQKKDISDPDVINEFATLVGDQAHLEYLYVLTVADVRGTNPKLWNSWKAQLFHDLYELTSRALRRGRENPIDREYLIGEKQAAAREILARSGVDPQTVDKIWGLLGEDYFLRCRREEIAWHTRILANHGTRPAQGFVEVRRQPDGDGIEATFYTPRTQRTFAHATAVIDELGMTIVDARIVPVAHDFSLDTYICMELDVRIEIDAVRIDKVRQNLARTLQKRDEQALTVTRPAPRQVRMFSTATEISFTQDPANRRTIMEIVAADRPGLLSTIGQTFIEAGVDIDTAKILTIGERAEDVFFITDENGDPLGDTVCSRLREQLQQKIDTENQ